VIPMADYSLARAVCYFDVSNYGRFLERSVPDLIDSQAWTAFTRLCDLLEDAVRLSRSPEGIRIQKTNSYVWRRSLDDAQFDTLREVLVTACAEPQSGWQGGPRDGCHARPVARGAALANLPSARAPPAACIT